MFKQPLVFFESERLCRFLFKGEPVLCKVVEEYGMPALCFHAARCGVVVESVNELLFQSIKIFGRNFDVDALSMKACLKDSVFLLAVGDDFIAVGKDMFVFGSHLFKLLFGKFEVEFFLLLRLSRGRLFLHFG